MKKYNFLNRILQIMIVLFGISFLTFLLTYMAPGDPVRAMYAASGTIAFPYTICKLAGELLSRRFRDFIFLQQAGP